MIDCEQVFDVLTRGPFPSGASSDAAVEAHLVECHECARLAAALRPAIELFQESIGPDEGRDLPGYWGEVAVESSDRAIVCAPPAERSISRPSRRIDYSRLAHGLTSLNLWRLAAAVALGMLLGSLFHAGSPNLEPPGGKAPETAAASGGESSAQLVAAPAKRRSLVLRLPQACVATTVSQHADEIGGRYDWIETRTDLLECCTRCHNATHTVDVPKLATAAVQNNCRHCHN